MLKACMRLACFHAFETASSTYYRVAYSSLINTVLDCQLFQRHDAGTHYTEWIEKDHAGACLRKILTTWRRQNIDALSFTLRMSGFP